MFAVGNVSVDALSKLLAHLGAGPAGSCHVVVTDVREELVVYVNGMMSSPPSARHIVTLSSLDTANQNPSACSASSTVSGVYIIFTA